MEIARSSNVRTSHRFEVGDTVVVTSLIQYPRATFSRAQRTGTVVALGKATMGPVVYVDLGWPIYESCIDPKGAADQIAREVKVLNPSFEGDGYSIICIAENFVE